jgi:hypothetical protein
MSFVAFVSFPFFRLDSVFFVLLGSFILFNRF